MKAKLLNQPIYAYECQIQQYLVEAGLKVNSKLRLQLSSNFTAIRIQYKNWQVYFYTCAKNLDGRFWRHFWEIIRRLALTQEISIESCYSQSLVAYVTSVSLSAYKEREPLPVLLTSSDLLKVQEQFDLRPALPATGIKLSMIISGQLDSRLGILTAELLQLTGYEPVAWNQQLIIKQCDSQVEKALSNQTLTMRASIYLGDIEFSVEELMQLRLGTKIQVETNNGRAIGFLKLGSSSVAEVEVDLNTPELEFSVVAISN